MNVIPLQLARSPFQFSGAKAAQAVATILRQEPHGQTNVHRLAKLIYLADRTALGEMGRPIVGGRLVATSRGPQHSALLDALQGRALDAAWWSKRFRIQHHQLELVDDPGSDLLSKREIDILNRVRVEHESRDDFELSEFTQALPEISSAVSVSVKPIEITFDQLLAAVGRSGDQAQIEKEAQEKAVVDRLFGV